MLMCAAPRRIAGADHDRRDLVLRIMRSPSRAKICRREGRPAQGRIEIKSWPSPPPPVERGRLEKRKGGRQERGEPARPADLGQCSGPPPRHFGGRQPGGRNGAGRKRKQVNPRPSAQRGRARVRRSLKSPIPKGSKLMDQDYVRRRGMRGGIQAVIIHKAHNGGAARRCFFFFVSCRKTRRSNRHQQRRRSWTSRYSGFAGRVMNADGSDGRVKDVSIQPELRKFQSGVWPPELV